MDQIARFYVGTYSRPLIFGTGEVFEGKGKGIHTYLFDMEKGTLMEEGAPTETANPSFVSLSADKELLYAVNELTTFEGKKGGTLNTYRRAENGLTEACLAKVQNSYAEAVVAKRYMDLYDEISRH